VEILAKGMIAPCLNTPLLSSSGANHVPPQLDWGLDGTEGGTSSISLKD